MPRKIRHSPSASYTFERLAKIQLNFVGRLLSQGQINYAVSMIKPASSLITLASEQAERSSGRATRDRFDSMLSLTIGRMT
jgi:hypothetical protein